MSTELLGPDGQPIPKTMIVNYNGRQYPYRVVNQEIINGKNNLLTDLAILVQMGDVNNLLFLAMTCLAKDIYTPGSREFLKLASQLNMNIVDIQRNETNVAAEILESINKGLEDQTKP